MDVKKLFLVLSAIVLVVACSFSMYFTFTGIIAKETVNSSALVVGASAVTYEDITIVSAKTQVIKRIKYAKGVPVYIEETEKSGAENIGMDRKAAVEFYAAKGWLVLEFTSKRVVLQQELALWPPGYYIVKESEGMIHTYHADMKGNLDPLKETGLSLESLPSQDQQDLKLGVPFKTLQEAEAMIEEYES